MNPYLVCYHRDEMNVKHDAFYIHSYFQLKKEQYTYTVRFWCMPRQKDDWKKGKEPDFKPLQPSKTKNTENYFIISVLSF